MKPPPPNAVHLVLLPACRCGCRVHLVAYLDEGGVIVERELDRNISREQGYRVISFIESQAVRFNFRSFPVSDIWMPVDAHRAQPNV